LNGYRRGNRSRDNHVDDQSAPWRTGGRPDGRDLGNALIAAGLARPCSGGRRTSSATNVGPDKDSLKRQEAAVRSYAKHARIEIVAEFYDPAVSGADPIDRRPGFTELLGRVMGNGVGAVLVEDASPFARDLAVQLAGHDHLKRLGVELIAANAPDHFREDTPTAVLVRQVLGAIARSEKAQLVTKLRVARERKRDRGEHWTGRKPVDPATVTLAKRLARKSPKTGTRRSLRKIAAELAAAGHVQPATGKPYHAESVKRMLT
jgi:DNA invertase Pin-like site-specific DNA recombinase